MRFTLVGHSTLLVEAGGSRIVVDPWLIGSCYWRAWWHFPPSEGPSPEMLAPDYVYVTHHHFDHLHYPSLRRVDRRAHVLVPRFGVDVMADEVRGLGFEQVSELPHGRVVTLAPGVRVASYQYGFDDTAFVIADGDHVLVDLNDCKIRGRAMEQVARDFPEPTFVFKSHSWAQSYPNCYEADDEADLGLLTRQSYFDDFLEAGRALRPRYAVPFGSMVAFLHPETLDLNEHIVTPHEVQEVAEAATDLDVVVMTPGDSWDSVEGFSIADDDWYPRRQEHLARMARSVGDTVERQTLEESEVAVSFGRFSAYLERFTSELPWPLRRMLLSRPVVFEIPSSSEPYWVIDFEAQRVSRSGSVPDEAASVVRVPEAVLADAIDKRILHFVHGSMRIRTRLLPGGVDTDLAFWGLLMVWEIGYLPVSRLFDRRFLAVLWRRRRELVDAADSLRGGGSMLRSLAGRFSPPDPESSGDQPAPMSTATG